MVRLHSAQVVQFSSALDTFFAWLFYSWPKGYFVWLTFPPAACVAMAAISMVATFTLCYWWQDRQISPLIRMSSNVTGNHDGCRRKHLTREKLAPARRHSHGIR